MSENEKKVPKLRFPGFTGDWEERKAGDLFRAVSDKGHEKLPVLSATQDKGMIYRNESGIDIKYNQDSLSTYKRILPNQFAIHLRSFQGGLAYSAIEGITSPAYTIIEYKDKQKHYSKFWKKRFTCAMFIKRLETVTYGIRDGRSISFTDFSTLKFRICSYSEQVLIGEFFDMIDATIGRHQHKLTHLKAEKNSLLQKMFPKEDQDFPELRFPGFTGAWKLRRLGELAKFAKGTGYSKSELVETGIPIILYGRLYTKYQTVIEEVDTFVLRKKNSVYSTGNEVVIPASGESSKDIARASAVIKSGILLGGDLNIIYPCERINPIFLAFSISNGEQRKELSQKAQGKSVVHLHNADLEGIIISYPNQGEQGAIVKFLSRFDRLIALHQRKLEHMEQLKKALLQSMFV